jgi:hypothetical protein
MTIDQRYGTAIVYELKRKVDDSPIIKGAQAVDDDELSLDERETEVVLVVTKDAIEVVVGIVFEKDGVNQDFDRCYKKHECEVVYHSVRHGSTEPTLNHICRQNQEGEK